MEREIYQWMKANLYIQHLKGKYEIIHQLYK